MTAVSGSDNILGFLSESVKEHLVRAMHSSGHWENSTPPFRTSAQVRVMSSKDVLQQLC